MPETEILSLEDGRRLIAAALQHAGVRSDCAASVARALVAAEAEGQTGHGFSRVADYVAQVRSGKLRGDAVPRLERVAPALVSIDAQNGFAYPALDIATEAASDMAREQGAGCVAIRRSHHCGALSVQVERVAQNGAVALMFANAPPAIAPWGATEPVFGTNPVAFACPSPDGPPFVADLSMSVVARGKIMGARKRGERIPAGWALDTRGEPTTDPEAALAGTMLPIGGAKGTVLAMIVEILAAAVTGANLSKDVSSFFDAEGPPPATGQLLLSIRPPDFEAFSARMRALVETVLAAEGARLPGARRREALARAEAEGLSVPRAYLDPIRAMLR